VDGSDVRMVQGREDLRFALESRKPIGISDKQIGQDLQRNIAPKLRITGAIHLAHAARAKGRLDLIRSESSTRNERHKVESRANCTQNGPAARRPVTQP
jgi:hypothetical protein